MKKRELIKRFEDLVGCKLREFGYEYNKKELGFIKVENQSFHSIIRFGRAVYRSPNDVWFAPMVFIAHKDVEELKKAVLDGPTDIRKGVTFYCSLGYLMPMDDYLEWKFSCDADDLEKPFRKYFKDIEKHAFPFIKKVSTRAGLIKFLEQCLSSRFKWDAYKTLPFLYYLEGQPQKCREFLEAVSKTIREDHHFHEFKNKFLNYLNEHP